MMTAPREHALSLIESSCQGDAHKALDVAHANVEATFRDDDRDYWDQVAVAIQQWIDLHAPVDDQVALFAFTDGLGRLLRTATASANECNAANTLLRLLGSDRRWMQVGF